MPSEDKYIKDKNKPFTSPEVFNKLTEGTSLEAEEIFAAFDNLIRAMERFRQEKMKLNPTDRQHLHNFTFKTLIPAVRYLTRGGVFEYTEKEIKEAIHKAIKTL